MLGWLGIFYSVLLFCPYGMALAHNSTPKKPTNPIIIKVGAQWSYLFTSDYDRGIFGKDGNLNQPEPTKLLNWDDPNLSITGTSTVIPDRVWNRQPDQQKIDSLLNANSYWVKALKFHLDDNLIKHETKLYQPIGWVLEDRVIDTRIDSIFLDGQCLRDNAYTVNSGLLIIRLPPIILINYNVDHLLVVIGYNEVSRDSHYILNEPYDGPKLKGSPSHPCVEGDVNRDGRLDMGDPITIMKYLVGIIPGNTIDLIAADYSSDEKVTIQDVILFLRYFVRLIISPPIRCDENHP
jgi:hypothetical protein